MAKNRKFQIDLEIVDREGPDESDQESCVALKDYIRDGLMDLDFDIISLQVSPK